MGNCNERCCRNKNDNNLNEKIIETTEERIEELTVDKNAFFNKVSLSINFPINEIKIKYKDTSLIPKFRLIIYEIPEFNYQIDESIDNFDLESISYIRTGLSKDGVLNFNNDIISDYNKKEINKECNIPLCDNFRNSSIYLYGFYTTIELTNKAKLFDLDITIKGMDLKIYKINDNKIINTWKNKNGFKYII